MRVKSNLDTIIYDHIVDSLVQGEYSMGQTILLDEFAEKYEVSRTPVTQAVRMLVADGLLEMKTNGRVRVPEYDEEQMKKICEVRYLLEKYVMEKICENDGVDEVFCGQLTKLAEQGVYELKRGDKLAFVKTDLEFHQMMVSEYGNEYLTTEYKKIQSKFAVANYLRKPLQDSNLDEVANGYREMIELLQEGKKEACQNMLKEYIFRIM